MIRLINRYSTNTNSVVTNLEWDLFDSFQKAAEKNQLDSYRSIYNFIIDQHFLSLIKGDLNLFYQFRNVMITLISNSTNPVVSKLLIENTAVNFKSFHLGYYAINNNNIKNIDNFYESVASFYQTILLNQEFTPLQYAFNEFNQLKDETSNFRRYVGLSDKMSNETFVELWQSYTQDNHSVQIHRQTSFALYSWMIYLYVENKIDEIRFSFLINQIDLQYNFLEDLLWDIQTISRKGYKGFLGLSDWDHTERLSGIIYSPPTPEDWIVYGACFYLISSGIPHLQIEFVLNDTNFLFLKNKVNEKLSVFRNDFSKWQKYLGIIEQNSPAEDTVQPKLQEYDERARQIISIFNQLVARESKLENVKFSSLEIDIGRVEKFKIQLEDRWAKQCIVFDLFEYFNALDKVEIPELPYWGYEGRLRGFRRMFVLSHQQEIYGAADLGGQVGRIFNDRMVNSFLRAKDNYYNADNFESGFDHAFASLNHSGLTPTHILIPPEILYKTNLYDDPNYQVSYEQNNVGIVGTYKEVSVSIVYSRYLTNQIIVSDFASAFSMRTNNKGEYHNGLLEIDLNEYSGSTIEEEYESNQREWSSGEADQEEENIKSLISNSMKVKIGVHYEMTILNPNAYSIFTLGIS